MKKQLSLSSAAICLLFSAALNAQVTSPTNNSIIGAQYVGYSGAGPGGAKDLDIKNAYAGKRINFFTGGFQRMTILDGGSTQTDGRIALGNNLPTAFVPTARLHIHETGSFPSLANPFMRFTTNTTGAAATDGYEMGIDPFGFASLINYEYGQPISFNTDNSSGAGGSPVERARLFGVTNSPSTPNNGGFGINATPGNSIIQPGAYLHIGEPVGVGSPICLTGLTGAFGWRDWMSIGKLSYSGRIIFT